MSNTNTPTNENNSTERKERAFSKSGDGWAEFMAPLFTASEGNGGVKKSFKHLGKTVYRKEHWSEAHRRHAQQKTSVFYFLRPHRKSVQIPCHIKITRYAPKKLDRFDNLPMSLKWILDACCAVITEDYRPGRADGYDGLEVSYHQIQCDEYWVHVRIENIHPENL